MSATSSRLKPALIALAIAAAGAAAYVSFNGQSSAPQIGFTGIDGAKISADSLRGKVVLVNFWATSCTTCVAEMPHMVETYNKYQRQGLEFVAVAMSYDPPEYVRNYAQSRQLPFKVALDGSGAAAKAFGDVKLTPTTFVIDKQGNILKRYVGEPQFAELHQLLEKALAA